MTKFFVRTSADDEWRMQHRPAGPDGIPMHDLTQGLPEDVYTHPQYYDNSDQGDQSFNDSYRQIQRVRGNPDAKVNIYRALPAEHASKGINPGDWVALSKDYARQHGFHATDSRKDWPVIRGTARAGDLHTDGDDLREFGYNGSAALPGQVAFKGGYEQQIGNGAAGGVAPVQRRPPSPVKGFSFNREDDPYPAQSGRVNAYDQQGGYAGHVKFDQGAVTESNIEPQHAALTPHLQKKMLQYVPKPPKLSFFVRQAVGPMTLNWARNTEPAPANTGAYDQDIEPAGPYVTEHDPQGNYTHHELGTSTFVNPLHMQAGEYGTPSSWKRQLSQQFGGQTGHGLSQAVMKAGHDAIVTHDKYGTGEIVDLTRYKAPKTASLDSLNPTGGLFTEYNPQARATEPLGGTLTTLDQTSGQPAHTMVTIYRGAPAHQREIAPGDFITTNPQLARDYAGHDNILSKQVPMSHVLDDSSEPLGEEYLYRPPAVKTAFFVRQAAQWQDSPDQQLTFQHSTSNGNNGESSHFIQPLINGQTKMPDGKPVGYLRLNGDVPTDGFTHKAVPGEILSLNVHPELRGAGLGRAMGQYAQSQGLQVVHSPQRTRDGDQFAKATPEFGVVKRKKLLPAMGFVQKSGPSESIPGTMTPSGSESGLQSISGASTAIVRPAFVRLAEIPGIQYQHIPSPSGTHHWVNAILPSGERIGDMTWKSGAENPADHHVTWIAVYDQEHRRQGVGTGMWQKAREVDPLVTHNTSEGGQTDAGAAWSQTTSRLAAPVVLEDFRHAHQAANTQMMQPSDLWGHARDLQLPAQRAKVTELGRSIQQQGYRPEMADLPIHVVMDHPSGKPVIFDGSHRLRAMQQIGYDQPIPVRT